MKISPIPEGFHTVTPYLVVKEASGLIQFMKDGLEAELAKRAAKAKNG